MNRIIFILFFICLYCTVAFAQQVKPTIREVKKSDFENHDGTLNVLLAFLDSTRDYSSYEILSFEVIHMVNGLEVVQKISGNRLLMANTQNMKVGEMVHIEKIKYVPKGQKAPVKMFPEIHFKIVD